MCQETLEKFSEVLLNIYILTRIVENLGVTVHFIHQLQAENWTWCLEKASSLSCSGTLKSDVVQEQRAVVLY